MPQLPTSPDPVSGADASIGPSQPPGQLSGIQTRPQHDALLPEDRVAHTRVLLVRGLRAHLLPLLDRDLDAAVARTGVSREALRKLRTALRAKGGTDRLPTADALTSIVTAYGWSLDRLLDPTCGDPALLHASAAHAGDAAGILGARAASVLRHAGADADDPDAVAIPRRPDVLIPLFDRCVRHVYTAARAERTRARAAALENWCSAAVARLERDDAVWCATQDAPALGRTAAVYAARLRRALVERRRDESTGELLVGEVTIRASDPWERVRDVAPALERLLAQDMALAPFIPVNFEITDAEVRSARAILRHHTYASAGHTCCDPDPVLSAYQRLLDQRRYPPDLIQPLRPIYAAAVAEHSDLHHAMVMLNELFIRYCEAVGAAWDAPSRRFRVLGPRHGSFDGILTPHWDEARLMIDFDCQSAAAPPPATTTA